ncbi:cyclase [Streptomyces sp. NBC_01264]|uniref:cyclase n=1 Tax=Streptomyces sp. NBC_01264 TaxID=2903804 RepID=UPI002255B7E2|nr:cyclase [Streptomyces sp. NBC_01264]MCX4781649.1 cyclase [Streptomyces sp. NBC_01264]
MDFACQAKPPIVGPQAFAIPAGVTATAPDAAAAGSTFPVSLATAPITVPGGVNGYTVRSISNLKLSMPIPANAVLTGKSLSGGSGLGSGVPSLTTSGSTLLLTVPGPIGGGQTFTLPVVHLDLTAGEKGTTVSTQLAGSSYSNPGLTFNASVPIFGFPVNVPTACYPSPNPVLSSTNVS